jgi:hypothetical protein
MSQNRRNYLSNLIVVAGIVFAMFVMGCSKAQLPVGPELSTTLAVVAITPTGDNLDSARVFLDGTPVGFTPYKNEAILAGVHALRVSKEGYQIFTDQLLVVENQKYNIEAVLTPMPLNVGELIITVNVDSAVVKVKNSEENVIVQSEKRVSSHMLPGGAYVVSGEKTGCPMAIKAVEVVSGNVTTVNLELTTPGTTPQAPGLEFSVQEDTVKVGESFNLIWNSDGKQVIIDQGVGVRGPNGSEKLTSSVTGLKIFTAAAYSTDNLVTAKKDTIYIAPNTPNPHAPSLLFSIVEDTVKIGESFNLSWQSNGHQVVIDQGVGVRGPNGAEKLVSNALGMKVFTATAYGENNLVTEKSDTVFVSPISTLPPTLTFDALADTIVFGEAAAIQWQSDGYQVVIDQGVGTRGPQGWDEVFFRSPGKKVFTATAYNENNDRTIGRDSVYVKEAPMPLLPVVMVSTTRRVTVNTPATISWLSQNADYLVVDYVNSPQVEGTKEITFSTPGIRIVTATAFNRAGYVSASDTIEVVEPNVISVEDIIVMSESGVRADKGAAGMQHLTAASFQVHASGQYRVMAEVWYNSGDEQLNESFYVQIRNGSGNIASPDNPNAGANRVVEDEAGDPHTASRGCGLFTLSAGSQTIELFHYAKIASQHSQFLNGPIDGPESVKILGFKLVYLGN